MVPRDDFDGPAVDTVAIQPGAVIGEVFSDGADQEGMLAQETEIKGDVGPCSSPQAGQGVDEERHAQDVHLVGQDMVTKPAWKDHDVVVSDRASDKNAHSACPCDYRNEGPGAGRS